MNYYIYLNAKGVTNKELLKIGQYAKTLKVTDFETFGDNTIYLTYKDNRPFVYKVTHTDDKDVESKKEFNPWEYSAKKKDDSQCLTAQIISEDVNFKEGELKI